MKRWTIGVLAVVGVLTLGGCEDVNLNPGSSRTSTAPEVASITLPDVAGRNLKIVNDELGKLGLHNVNFSSVDPKHSTVIQPANWVVVDIEPAAGTKVAPKQAVVLKVKKTND